MTNRIVTETAAADKDADTLALIDASWARWEHRRLLPAGYYAVLARLGQDAPHNVPEAPGPLAPAGQIYLRGYGFANQETELARQWEAANAAADDLYGPEDK